MVKGQRLRAGILGATGSVGQQFVALLAGHPWFEITALAASARSAGKPYSEAVRWLGTSPLPPSVGDQVVQEVTTELDCDFVFSALDSGPAAEHEPALARAGHAVISNAGAFRMDPLVPLMVPEVNPTHSGLIKGQPYGSGCIVTNPNCSTTGLVCALKPLAETFGVEAVHVTTMQAVSGAGYPGVPSLDILGNVVPYIRNEEEKLETEPQKILGTLQGGRIEPASFRVSAQTNRVPVLDGHLLSIAVALTGRPSVEAVRDAFVGFGNPLADLALPSAPPALLHVFPEGAHPQPRLDAGRGNGMTVSIGRLRPCPLLGVRFVALVHNTLRGAAGGAILNAELLRQQGLLGG